MKGHHSGLPLTHQLCHLHREFQTNQYRIRLAYKYVVIDFVQAMPVKFFSDPIHPAESTATT